MKKNNSFFRAISSGSGLKNVHQFHQGEINAKQGIFPIFAGIFKEFIMNDLLFILVVLLIAVRKNHVMQPLKSATRNFGIISENLEIFLKTQLPVEILIDFLLFQ